MKISRLARILLALAVMALAVPAPGQAARISPREGLELLRSAFAGVNDFTAEITQEKQIALMKKKLVANGIVRFRKPDSFMMELNPPHASRVLLRDNVISTLLPADGVRQKIVLPPDEGLARWFALMENPVTSLPDGVAVQAERNGDAVTISIAPSQGRGVKNLQVILATDGKLRRVIIEEQNRDRTVISFRNVRRNVGLTDRDFRIE
ncbi:LolA family protein [Geobacter sulfurreducens]|uniref:LolA family protein n=1 Tax=Geobacter sulfurreducens TaxID=35554 RepID=UPI0020B7C42A|nr:outer membrane lipoprotein carrier protein LolA [Geobacter sulfurreducens]UTG93152.1 outer membrane lipoprotein carrier protein LolA [Geobacter sulfurreducens]